jgi:hypothetical protein
MCDIRLTKPLRVHCSGMWWCQHGGSTSCYISGQASFLKMEAAGSWYVGNIVLREYAASIFRKINHILNMEAEKSSETLEPIYQTKYHLISQSHSLHAHHQNLKSHNSTKWTGNRYPSTCQTLTETSERTSLPQIH